MPWVSAKQLVEEQGWTSADVLNLQWSFLCEVRPDRYRGVRVLVNAAGDRECLGRVEFLLPSRDGATLERYRRAATLLDAGLDHAEETPLPPGHA